MGPVPMASTLDDFSAKQNHFLSWTRVQKKTMTGSRVAALW